jgi:hypothetical protein
LRNVAALLGLVERLQNRTDGLPGLGIFHGKSGAGKTSAVTFAANEFDAHVVSVKPEWSKRFFVETMADEMGVQARRSEVPYFTAAISAHLAVTDRPLIIDDAQFLLRQNRIELIWSIYESSQAPIVLVGETNLPLGLTKWENIHNRVLAWQATYDCNISDAERLAQVYCAGVEVAPDLLSAIVQASNGTARRIVTNLDTVKELARSRGLKTADLTLWGDNLFFTGQPPEIERPEVYPGASLKKWQKAARA